MTKLQAHLALQTRPKQGLTLSSNHLDTFSYPGNIMSSFSHYGPSSHLVRDQKPKISTTFYNMGDENKGNFGFTAQITSKGNTAQKAYFNNNGPFSSPSSQNFVQTQFFGNSNLNPGKIYQKEEPVYAPPPPPPLVLSTTTPPFQNIPSSVLTPFFQQIQQQQLQQNLPKENEQKTNVIPNYISLPKLEPVNQSSPVINDEFAKHLVPPPPYKHQDSSEFRPIPSKAVAAVDAEYKPLESLNQYNIPLSPLQDANRFSYNTGNFFGTTTQSSPIISYSSSSLPPKQPQLDQLSFTTDKPNVFKQLTRPLDNEYKTHKVMHPSYTGAKHPNDHFIPTPNSPENHAISHSFFTIEDAITIAPIIHDEHKSTHSVAPEKISSYFPPLPRPTNQAVLIPQIQEVSENVEIGETVVTLSSSVPSQIQMSEYSTSSPRERQKNRRRRPKPQVNTETSFQENSIEIGNKNNNRNSGRTTNRRPVTSTDRPNRIRTEIPQRTTERQRINSKPVFTIRTTTDESKSQEDEINYMKRQRKPVTTQETKLENFKETSIETNNDYRTVTRNRIGYTTNLPKEIGHTSTAFSSADETTPIELSTLRTRQNLPDTVSFQEIILDTPTTEHFGYEHVKHRPKLRYSTTTIIPSTTTDGKINEIEFIPIEDNVVIPIEEKKEIISKITSIQRQTTTIPTTTTTTATVKSNGIKTINKYEPNNRPRFSVKEYRQRNSSTTNKTIGTTPETSTQTYTRLRFPTRNRLLPDLKNKMNLDEPKSTIKEESNTIEVKPFENIVEIVETSSETIKKRIPNKEGRYRSSTQRSVSISTTTSRTPNSRRGSNTRRDYANRNRVKPSGTITETKTQNPIIRTATTPLKRPAIVSLRQRIQNRKKESNEVTMESKMSDDTVTEGFNHETAIMKIAKDDHSYRPYAHTTSTEFNDSENDLSGSPSEQSQRVADLTVSGDFKSVNTGLLSRKIPGYFTLATEDPILPIEAFFPQVKKE